MESKTFSSTVLCLSQRVEVLGDLSQRQTNNSLSTESESLEIAVHLCIISSDTTEIICWEDHPEMNCRGTGTAQGTVDNRTAEYWREC